MSEAVARNPTGRKSQLKLAVALGLLAAKGSGVSALTAYCNVGCPEEDYCYGHSAWGADCAFVCYDGGSGATYAYCS